MYRMVVKWGNMADTEVLFPDSPYMEVLNAASAIAHDQRIEVEVHSGGCITRFQPRSLPR